jgi:hypothetical protein
VQGSRFRGKGGKEERGKGGKGERGKGLGFRVRVQVGLGFRV